jgi:hypothetical protein
VERTPVTATPPGSPYASPEFGYRYFDDPQGDGYRGYYRDHNGDGDYLPWAAAREFCLANRVQTAIDVGCAKGFLVDALLSAGISAVGYDISTYALSFARRLPCYVADIRCGLPHTAEAVFALGVLLYLDEKELDAALGNIRASTGRFLLVSGYYAGGQQENPDPLRLITRSRLWWRQQIERAGFHFDHEGAVFDVYVV